MTYSITSVVLLSFWTVLPWPYGMKNVLIVFACLMNMNSDYEMLWNATHFIYWFTPTIQKVRDCLKVSLMCKNMCPHILCHFTIIAHCWGLVITVMRYEKVLLSTAQSSLLGLPRPLALFFSSQCHLSPSICTLNSGPAVEWWRTWLSRPHCVPWFSLATTATTWPATGCWRPLRANAACALREGGPRGDDDRSVPVNSLNAWLLYTISYLMFKETVGEAQSVSSQCRHTPNVALLFRALSATARARHDRNSCECVSESGWKFLRSDTCSPLNI